MNVDSQIVWRVFLVRALLQISQILLTCFQPEKEPPLILLWNKYQKTGSGVYRTIFQRITEGHCKVCLVRDLSTQFSTILPQTVCRVTQDKNLQNLSAAIVFHMPVRSCLPVGLRESLSTHKTIKSDYIFLLLSSAARTFTGRQCC